MLYAHEENGLAVTPPVSSPYPGVNYQVNSPDVLHQAARIVAHKGEPPVAVLDDYIADQHISHMAVDVAQHQSFGTGTQDAVRDHHVLAGLGPVGNAGNSNAVIAAGDVAAGDNHAIAAAHMNTIIIGYPQVGVNGEPQGLGVFALGQGEGPARGVQQGDAPQGKVFYLVEEDRLGGPPLPVHGAFFQLLRGKGDAAGRDQGAGEVVEGRAV